MTDTGRLLTAVGRFLRALTSGGSRTAPAQLRRAGTERDASPARVADDEVSPGQAGPDATVEIDPRKLRGVRMGYTPSHDGEPDPGEVVWTWVPYEERDGRGKDRPVVIVAASDTGDYLAVQLTSKPHDGDRDYVSLGEGAWDAEGRPSWVKTDRVFRVRAAGMRREAASLDAERYGRIADALARRYGWS